MSDLGDTPYDRGYVNGYRRWQSEAEDVAQAMVAAAYEAAAQTAFDHTPTKHGGAPLVAHVTGATIEREIRALTPADARDAQAARDERMRAEGAREAEARNVKLANALRPFAKACDALISQAPDHRRLAFGGEILTYGDFRRARAALQENGYEC